MDKWEYNTIYLTLNDDNVWHTTYDKQELSGLYNCLDAVGAYGWELVNTIVADYTEESNEDLRGRHGRLRATKMIAVFKRPK